MDHRPCCRFDFGKLVADALLPATAKQQLWNPRWPPHAKSRTWRAETKFADDEDWVFPTAAGERPYSASTMQTRVLMPAGRAIGLEFSLGWHTFRHSYRAWLEMKQVPLTAQRDLMRHADIRTTARTYGNVRMEELRGANSDVVKRVIIN